MIAALQLDFTADAGVPDNRRVIQTAADGTWLTTALNCTDTPANCTSVAANQPSSNPSDWTQPQGTTGTTFNDSSWTPVADSGLYGISPWATLTDPSSPSANNIKVNSVTGFAAGDSILIGSGADQEVATIAAGGVGTAGATGTGLTLTANLTIVHATGLTVLDLSKPGTGVTFTPALATGHAIGAAASDPGSGITFSPALTKPHAAGTTIRGLGSGIAFTPGLSPGACGGRRRVLDRLGHHVHAGARVRARRRHRGDDAAGHPGRRRQRQQRRRHRRQPRRQLHAHDGVGRDDRRQRGDGGPGRPAVPGDHADHARHRRALGGGNHGEAQQLGRLVLRRVLPLQRRRAEPDLVRRRLHRPDELDPDRRRLQQRDDLQQGADDPRRRQARPPPVER